jgi:hypothetical protein
MFRRPSILLSAGLARVPLVTNHERTTSGHLSRAGPSKFRARWGDGLIFDQEPNQTLGDARDKRMKSGRGCKQ